jgi:hypothetical protein
LIGTVAQIEPPRSAAEIQLSDDPKLENTTASSSYLPLDSWVYPAMERLYSLGYLDTAFLGLRPWTRISCARMLAEAEKKVAASESSYVIQLFNSLEEEFSGDLAALGSPAYARLESVYGRALDIAGPNAKASQQFVPGGTTQNDFSARAVVRVRHDLELTAFGQLEMWKAPVLATGLQRNFTTTLQLTYFPNIGLRAASHTEQQKTNSRD